MIYFNFLFLEPHKKFEDITKKHLKVNNPPKFNDIDCSISKANTLYFQYPITAGKNLTFKVIEVSIQQKPMTLFDANFNYDLKKENFNLITNVIETWEDSYKEITEYIEGFTND